MTSKEKYRMLVLWRLENKIYDGHLHHIIPKCFHKKDNRTVMLTLEEHTLAHYWLWHACPLSMPDERKNMRAAYIGLRNQWFHSRYRFRRDADFKRLADRWEKKLKKFFAEKQTADNAFSSAKGI